MGIRLIPGKSIRVRSGHVLEHILSIIGMLTIFLFFPATNSVNSKIFSLTILKSVNLESFISSNVAYGEICS